MAYRKFSTATWQDPWFEKLNKSAKLLFIYLWTNEVCNQSGLYQISHRRIEFETGLKIHEVVADLSPKVEWFDVVEIVWVKNFFKWQCQNPKFALAAVRSLYCIPKEIVEKFTQYNGNLLNDYGIDTVSIPYQDVKNQDLGVCLSVTVTEQKQKQKQKTVSADTVSSGFLEFWKSYPKKVGKIEAEKAWTKANGKRPPLESILAKLDHLKKSKQWIKDGGQFIPNPATWINQGRWDDEAPSIQADECPGFDWSKP